MDTLVEPRELAVHLNDPDWVILDCRHELTDAGAGRAAYARGHIPGARFLAVDEELSGARSGRNGRHPLPASNDVAAVFARLGIGSGTQVIAYDAQGGAFAARAWWTLRWLGHRDAAVLDGGWQRWMQEVGSSTTELPAVRPAQFAARASALHVDADAVARGLAGGTTFLVDARAPERFRGDVEPLDPVAGHVPGAVNRPYADNLRDGRFKPADVLRAEWLEVLRGAAPETTVHMCGSGVTACHNLLALEVAGLTGGRLYPGSWSEWCADPRRPVAKGS